MNLSPKGAAFVRGHEGFVGRYYLDPVGIGTIGIGFTWRSNAFRIWWGTHKPGVKFGPGATMTREEADDALAYLFSAEYAKAVNDFLRKNVPQHVFDATASPVYNCGPGSLKWKWAAFVKAGDYAAAAMALRTTAVTAQGVRLAGLVRRRKEEALLMEHGIYTGVSHTEPGDTATTTVLRRGARGAEVRTLLQDLAALGFYTGKLDGIFGHGAEAAVLAFQRSKGLKADGVAGPRTLAAITQARGITPTPSTPEPQPPATPEPQGWLAWLLSFFISSR